MFKQRILTASILLPIVIALLIYLTPLLFCVLTGLIFLGGAWEWSRLMELNQMVHRGGYVLLVFVMMVAALYLPIPIILLLASIWWVFALILIWLYPRGAGCWRNWYCRAVMGLMVLIPAWVALNAIRNENEGIMVLLFLCVIIWGADSAAYFVGKKWGKSKFIPDVSPGKSAEGLMGAFGFTFIFCFIVLGYSHAPLSLWPYIIGLTIVTVLFSVVGDLFESMMKRQASLKDSGGLLPGHGGLLDRIDSLTAAAPVFAFCALLLSKYLG